MEWTEVETMCNVLSSTQGFFYDSLPLFEIGGTVLLSECIFPIVVYMYSIQYSSGLTSLTVAPSNNNSFVIDPGCVCTAPQLASYCTVHTHVNQ